MAKEENNNGKFVAGAVIGALFGAVAGILFAPRGGKDTRKLIKDRAKEYSEKGKEMLIREEAAAKKAIEGTVEKISK